MLLNIHELHKWEKTSLGLMTFRERREGGDRDGGGTVASACRGGVGGFVGRGGWLQARPGVSAVPRASPELGTPKGREVLVGHQAGCPHTCPLGSRDGLWFGGGPLSCQLPSGAPWPCLVVLIDLGSPAPSHSGSVFS